VERGKCFYGFNSGFVGVDQRMIIQVELFSGRRDYFCNYIIRTNRYEYNTCFIINIVHIHTCN
jgi:hypothetical protein